MSRIVHISDLHFGREAPELLEPLRKAIDIAKPDVVAVTGDFTQRARPGQFRAARAFLDNLCAPWVGVPGNHDIPLDIFWLRLLWPFGRYRKYISEDLAPLWENADLTMQGLNTADPWSWQRGRVRRGQVRLACEAFSAPDRIHVVLAHHPFEHQPDTGKTLMKRAPGALDRLAKCNAQLILSGHLHRWRAEPFLSSQHGAHMLQVHVGTGLSTRSRGQGNDFAVIDLAAPGEAEVTRMVAHEGRFTAEPTRCFVRDDDGWREEPGKAPTGTVQTAPR